MSIMRLPAIPACSFVYCWLLELQDNRHLYPACNKVISHLTAVSEELVDVPLYFSLHDVCKTVKCTPPKADVLRSALINAGENSYTISSQAVIAYEFELLYM